MEQVDDKKQTKRRKLVTLILFIIIFGAVFAYAGIEYRKWWQARQELVKLGFAENKFPYRMLTERELVEKGLWSGESPALNAVPTRTTPEEAYAKFRQALAEGNIDKAAECFVKEKREEYKRELLKVKEEGRIEEVLKKLSDISPEGDKIVEGSIGESMTSYEFFYKEKESDVKFTNYTIIFYKNWDGDWEMNNL